MKIAFSTSGESLDAPLDTRFGRAARFLVYDTATDATALVDNAQNLAAAQGAGIQAAQNIVKNGINALVSGHCGPKAFRVLNAAGIAVYTCNAATVAEALKLFRDGKLPQLDAANAEAHWA